MRAQREGALDYREYLPGDSGWKLRESLILASLENAIVADQLKAVIPVVHNSDILEKLLSDIVETETPWVSKVATKEERMRQLAEMWRKHKESQGDKDGH